MIGLEAILAVVTYTAAVIASLQAGSRAKYLLEHNEIGIKDGPLILPPAENETSPLWDLVQVFQHGVRLGLMYRLDGDAHGFVIQDSLKAKPDDYYNIEPYSLSPYPKMANEDELLDKIVEMYIEDGRSTDDKEEEEEESPQGRLSAVTSILWPASYISRVKQSTRYWATRAWFWRKNRQEFEDLFLEDKDDENLDLSLCVSKNMRLASSSRANNETQQVAQVTAYAPEGFAKLRSLFRIPEADFRRSIFECGPYVSFQSNSKGAARAGGVFFFTRDGAYMIKTIKKAEAETLIQMLPKYYKHMKRNHRHSLLTRFCGMYRVGIRDATSLTGFKKEEQYTFVVMNSVFPPKASNFITEMYDLKGSTVGRECSAEERQRKGRNAILKDLDLTREVEMVRSMQNKSEEWSFRGYGLNIGAVAKSNLLAQLRKDVSLLRECNVMDYSLLVGVVNLQPERHMDAADVNAVELSGNLEKTLQRKWSAGKRRDKIFTTVMTPVRVMIAPPLYVSRMLWSLIDRTMTSILTYPLPYYDSQTCGVDGGSLSVIHGSKSGTRVLFYMGVIDFLQPWTPRKVAERKLKGLLGQDVAAISCVDPEEYATRFLQFIDAHVS